MNDQCYRNFPIKDLKSSKVFFLQIADKQLSKMETPTICDLLERHLQHLLLNHCCNHIGDIQKGFEAMMKNY